MYPNPAAGQPRISVRMASAISFADSSPDFQGFSYLHISRGTMNVSGAFCSGVKRKAESKSSNAQRVSPVFTS